MKFDPNIRIDPEQVRRFAEQTDLALRQASDAAIGAAKHWGMNSPEWREALASLARVSEAVRGAKDKPGNNDTEEPSQGGRAFAALA